MCPCLCAAHTGACKRSGQRQWPRGPAKCTLLVCIMVRARLCTCLCGSVCVCALRMRVCIHEHILDTHRHPNAQMQCRCTAMPLCEPPLETKQQLRRWCPAKWRTATPSQSCTRQLRRHDAKSNHTINSIATLSVLYCHVCASSSLCLSPLAHSYRFGEDDVKKGYGA